MGDAGEGLIDAEARIQERMEELERERSPRSSREARDPERVRAVESLKLARLDLERQFSATAHEGRRSQLQLAMSEIDRRLAAIEASPAR